MTTRATLLISAVLFFGPWIKSGSAEQPCPAPSICGTGRCALPVLGGCPDDYCRKQIPPINFVQCGGPDDYCYKPWPRVYCWRFCGGVDDYNLKPCPSPCRPMDTSLYSCVSLCRKSVLAK